MKSLKEIEAIITKTKDKEDLLEILEYINQLEERLNLLERRFIIYGQYINNTR
jgi:hypothetical protein